MNLYRANMRIGRWLSAALDDPNVCTEMKDDINAWFQALGLESDTCPMCGAGGFDDRNEEFY